MKYFIPYNAGEDGPASGIIIDFTPEYISYIQKLRYKFRFLKEAHPDLLSIDLIDHETRWLEDIRHEEDDDSRYAEYLELPGSDPSDVVVRLQNGSLTNVFRAKEMDEVFALHDDQSMNEEDTVDTQVVSLVIEAHGFSWEAWLEDYDCEAFTHFVPWGFFDKLEVAHVASDPRPNDN